MIKTGDFDLRSFFIFSKKDLAMKRRMYVEDDEKRGYSR